MAERASNRRRILLDAALAGAVVVGTSCPTASAGLRLDNAVIGAGGGRATSHSLAVAWTVGQPAASSDVPGPGSLSLRTGFWPMGPITGERPLAHIVQRRVFYNQSAWDGNTPGADPRDDAAVATDKEALLPGQTATFANYTSYSRGLNGIMVDVLDLPPGVGPSAADFDFRTGNDNAVDAWPAAAAPATTGGITIRRGVGPGGSDRVTLIWGTGAVTKKWLQIRVKATVVTGLAAADVFYFGNAIGESGDHPGLDAIVNASDEILARSNSRTVFNPAPVTFPYDHNRDRLVNATDQILARFNTTSAFTALRLIHPPAEPVPASFGAAGSPVRMNIIRELRDEGSVATTTTTTTTTTTARRLDEPPVEGAPTRETATLAILSLADGRIAVQARGALSRPLRLEVALPGKPWVPVEQEGVSTLADERFWLVGEPATRGAMLFRLVEP